MSIRSLAAALIVSLAACAPAYAQTIPKIRSDLLDSCAPENLLCRHLRTQFGSPLSSRSSDGIPIWRSKIKYITAGLSPDGDALFDDLIESFAARAGLQVQRVPFEDAREANFTVLVTPNVGDAIQGQRYGSLVGQALSTEERERMAAEWKNGFAVKRLEYSTLANRYVIAHCYHGMHPETLTKRPGLHMAMMIYTCLTGGRSNVIRPSLANVTLPVELDAPPYAKMTSLDRATLEILYDRNSPVNSSSAASVVVERIERRLREQGFGDDGLKH
ncbi:hypothetical protein [Roseiterribacter gracilis]|uniref:DUF2927 domain-containing protein n=1 Tax=Roseiterribacter gracilis TaxID=2812848 RepID=A0A8S8XH38_9PROT|nr:hypothetical protein TMPK1_27120 [Rhodospirillales bacterium TMPK1]